jgi:hypothetical protein
MNNRILILLSYLDNSSCSYYYRVVPPSYKLHNWFMIPFSDSDIPHEPKRYWI